MFLRSLFNPELWSTDGAASVHCSFDVNIERDAVGVGWGAINAKRTQ
jgi:hypothetical protein